MRHIEISELVVRLLFLFIPGILSTLIIDMLTSHKKRNPFNFIVHSYLIGVASYGILLVIVKIVNQIVTIVGNIPKFEVHFLNALFDSNEPISVLEVFFASLTGSLIAIIFSIVISKKYIYRAANYLNISEKHGDGDVWDHLLGSNDVEWVIIRDLENGLVYQGAVNAFSQKEDKREVILSQVKVYKDEKRSDLKEMYDMTFIYFNFDSNSNVVIEIQKETSENDEQ